MLEKKHFFQKRKNFPQKKFLDPFEEILKFQKTFIEIKQWFMRRETFEK